MDNTAIIEIYDSTFEDNGFPRPWITKYPIIYNDVNTYISLDIIRSQFIATTSCRVVLFDVTGTGSNLIIEYSTFIDNVVTNTWYEEQHGMFNVEDGDITINNVQFESNIMTRDGIFVTGTIGSVSLSSSNYTDNTVLSIVSESNRVTVEDCDFNGNTVEVNTQQSPMVIGAMINASFTRVVGSRFVSNAGSC